MKKQISILLAMVILASAPMAMAITDTTSPSDVKAPVWEEYVPKKYQNPRSFPSKGKNIAELSVGIVLTDLLITAPVGIPMVCHASTKMKNQGWYEKKAIFENGLKYSEHKKQMKKLEKQAKKKH